MEAANQITELCRKLKKFGAQYRESRTKETETKRKLIDCKNKCSDTQYQLSMLQSKTFACGVNDVSGIRHFILY